MRPIKLIAVPMPKITARSNLCDIVTKPYPAIRPRIANVAVISKIPTQPLMSVPRRRFVRRHAVSILVIELLYAVIALALGYAAYLYLAAWPVYRIVAGAVIIILWSNLANIAARKKPLDMRDTMDHPALRVWDQKKKKKQASYIETTDAYLQAIKMSLLDQ